MRILFIEPCFVNFGGYFRAKNLCDGLNSQGHQIDLLVSSNKKFCFSIKKTILKPNYHLYELPRFYFHNFFQGRFLRALISIIFALKKPYDIYHIAMPVSPESTIPALFLKFIGKKNIVLDWDELFENGALKNNYLMHSYALWVEHNFPKWFKHHTVVSRILNDTLSQRGADQVLKIINGVNQNQFKRVNSVVGFKKLAYDQKYLYLACFANTFYGDRGVKLLETIKHLFKLNPKIKLITNFSPNDIGQLNKYQLDPELKKNIISVGFIPPSDLGVYMSISQGSLFYMANTIQDRSGFPIRVGSSLNGHLPIFTNDNDSEVSHTLSETGCAILAKTPEQLAQEVASVLNSPSRLKKLKQQTVIASKQLSVESQANKLVHFYYKILSSIQLS